MTVGPLSGRVTSRTQACKCIIQLLNTLETAEQMNCETKHQPRHCAPTLYRTPGYQPAECTPTDDMATPARVSSKVRPNEWWPDWRATQSFARSPCTPSTLIVLQMRADRQSTHKHNQPCRCQHPTLSSTQESINIHMRPTCNVPARC